MLSKCLICHDKIISMSDTINWFQCRGCGIVLYDKWTTETLLEWFKDIKKYYHELDES